MALPIEYTQLEYIESSGAQYIDTGITGSVPLKVEATVKTGTGTKTTDSMIMASYDGTNTTVPLYWYKDSWYIEVGKTGTQSSAGTLSDNTKYNVVFEATNARQRLAVNGTDLIDITGSFTGSTKTLYLFGRNYNGSATHCCSARIYALKMHQNGVLVRDFVPAMRNSDGEVGLYDT